MARRRRNRLRHDGDLQVEFHLDGKPGRPFESLFCFNPARRNKRFDRYGLQRSPPELGAPMRTMPSAHVASKRRDVSSVS
jgi:hypothetical protein